MSGHDVTSRTEGAAPGDLPRLPARPRDGHKGVFGTVAVVGGCVEGAVRMVGAPALAATAALRSGCGLARIVVPTGIISEVLTICPSATGIALAVEQDTGAVIPHEAAETLDSVIDGCDALVIGPGMGTGAATQTLALRAVQQECVPVVVDADAINALAAIPELIRDLRGACVLTPHPGEFKRLCEGLGLKNDLGLAQSRERACEQMAQRLGCVVVLKGAGTVVSDGLRSWTCSAGHSCLGTAGTGDVLAGLLAGVIAQACATVDQMQMRARMPQMPRDPKRPLDLYDAARVGVWAHAKAGELWAHKRGADGGLLAMELADLLPETVQMLRGG